MKNPFDFFDEIYCINLDNRIDRWKHAQKEFDKVGIKDRVIRFSAIKEDDGRLGIIKSNLGIVKLAKKKKLKNVLVFEDDVEFIVDNPLEVLSKSIDDIGNLNWSLFYLGANTHNKLIKIKKHLILLKNSFAVHSMAYNENIYDVFIQKYDGVKMLYKHSDILDVFLAQEIQEKYICLMVNPMMTSQINSYSDIEKCEVNYDFIKERFKNNIK